MSADAINPEHIVPAQAVGEAMSPEPIAAESGVTEPTTPTQATPDTEDEEAPRKRGIIARLGGRRLAFIAVFAILLIGSLAIWITYLTTRQSIQQILPPAKAVLASTLQPRYLFSINGVSEPYGVAVTPEGDRIYVVEGMGQRLVRVFDRDGKQVAAFGPPDSNESGRQPMYVAVDNEGLVYVTDKLRMAVDIYDGGGNYQRSIRSPFADKPWFPLGIQVDGDTLLVTEVTQGNHRVLRLAKDGKLLSELGSEGEEVGQFEWPQAVATDSRGRIYVSDGNNGRVQAFDRDGKLLSALSDLALPRGVEVDGFQRLHLVDTIAQEVVVYDVSGDQVQRLFSFGSLGTGDGQFNYPNNIAIDDTDRLYITDRLNNRVQVWVY